MTALVAISGPAGSSATDGCSWWNLVCQGGQQVADSGMAAITSTLVNGLVMLFGQITKIVEAVTVMPGEAFRIIFTDNSTVSISLRPSDYVCAEAIYFQGREDKWNVIWPCDGANG